VIYSAAGQCLRKKMPRQVTFVGARDDIFRGRRKVPVSKGYVSATRSYVTFITNCAAKLGLLITRDTASLRSLTLALCYCWCEYLRTYSAPIAIIPRSSDCVDSFFLGRGFVAT